MKTEIKELSQASLAEIQQMRNHGSMLTKRYVPGYFVYSKYWSTIDLVISSKDGNHSVMALTDPNYKLVSKLEVREHCTPFGTDNVLLRGTPYQLIRQLEAEGVDVNPIFDIINKKF